MRRTHVSVKLTNGIFDEYSVERRSYKWGFQAKREYGLGAIILFEQAHPRLSCTAMVSP
jgi:hypothetical protein